MENRSVETVKDLIPADLLKGLESKEYLELNGFMVSGSYVQIQELKGFLKAIDIVVPMVQIDIMIVLTSQDECIKYRPKSWCEKCSNRNNWKCIPWYWT